ncbi:Vsp/OspC family lipoprotein [Borrelia hermsii]|uniref:Vsp6silH protein n=3 Tax=Borrelia hermsii TaxID=140 RepID=Q1CNZ5_BORHD|nr:Vsp/OspC family lipoprotein [Borrelia hermsii]ABF82166.1 Vsp6silH [Borrelia hermsii DAH]AMR76105.1 Variable small protein 6 [Borrelia hermsii]ANA43927.1 Vsp6 [Borrelia hermsii HS1]UPA08679.1 hypothetical protein bhDAH_001408 [Borrelia hermsii DAH]
MRKRISAIIMTLFMVFTSCNNGGPELKSDEVAKSDGTVLDLAKISKKIKEASAFAESVKEVETLVKSIDELAKAIGKKIKNDDDGFDTEANKNGSLLAGTLQLMFAVGTKLESLEKIAGISDEVKGKVIVVKTENTALITKLKGGDASLGKNDASDSDAKNAIDKSDVTGGKGKEELIKLNTAVDALLKAAEGEVEAAIKELTAPVKVEKPSQNN